MRFWSRTVVSCIILTAALVTSASADENNKKRETSVASNGVPILITTDEFADRIEFTAPPVLFKANDIINGSAILGRVRIQGNLGEIGVNGVISYGGAARQYNSALFKGGDKGHFEPVTTKRVTCSGNYCFFIVHFIIMLPAAEIGRHMEDGQLLMQVRDQDSRSAAVSIPKKYVDALNEVTGVIGPPCREENWK